jgi:hypothetical protein
MALAMTAKHVLEGMSQIQKPHPTHAGSAIFVPARKDKVRLNKSAVSAVYMNSERAEILSVIHASYVESFDIAVCLLAQDCNSEFPLSSATIPLELTTPQIGDVVHMVSLTRLRMEEINPPVDATGTGRSNLIERAISIRVGKVSGVYPNGLRQYKWPCFTTTIPAEPGMSGGFVYRPVDGRTVAACGIICADGSSEESRSNAKFCGESVIGCTWPALALRIPNSIPKSDGPELPTIYEMMKIGKVPPPIEGILGVDFINHGQDKISLKVRS